LDGLSDLDEGMVPGKSYALASKTPGVEATDLFFKEVARNVDIVMKHNGYRPVEEGGTPDFIIGLNAHLSEPMVETHSYSEPIYAHGGGGSYMVSVPVVNKQGTVVRYVSRRYSYGPSFHYAGTIERDKQYTVFDKVLILSAYRLDSPEEVWNLKVSLRGQSSDYRSSLPYMLVAAQSHIGKRTEGEEVIAIKKESPQVVEFIKQLRDE